MPIQFLRIDIFCKVIDNYGDIGVCWRLCTQLVAQGHSVRFVVDDASALAWMATSQERSKITLAAWTNAVAGQTTDVVIETFGCELPESYIATLSPQCRWLNLEHLSAERYVENCHLLPSPVLQGAGNGRIKTFFYPGFTAKTGGLLRESDLLAQQAVFDKVAWLKTLGIECQKNERIVSLFCYEPAALPTLLVQLQLSEQPTLLLVTTGRATQAVKSAQEVAPISSSKLRIHYLPPLTQGDFDRLLWSSDFNFVRGEDSLVRAIWAGKPFIWQIYPQDDQAHHAKLASFLALYLQSADETTAKQIRCAHDAWNAMSAALNWPVEFVLKDLSPWRQVSQSQRKALLVMPSLLDALLTAL